MTQCVACGRTSDIGFLCKPCLQRLADTLHAIQTETELLSAVPTLAAPTGGRGGTLASHRTPARLDVATHTDRRPRRIGWSEDDDEALAAGDTLAVLDVLHSRARTVREERRLTPPEREIRGIRPPGAPAGPYCHHLCGHASCDHIAPRWVIPAPVTVTTERRLLSNHLSWIAEQEWVDEFAAELATLLSQLRRANGTHPEPPIGRCYLPTDSGASCDGPIWVDDAAGHAHCSWCRNTWDGAQLAMLKHEMDRQDREHARPHTDDGRPMLTAQELVDQGYVTSVSNVRVAAHRRGHRAVHGHYDPAVFGARMSA